MIHREQKDIAWLEFELFQQFPKLKHGVFLRTGGLSFGEDAEERIQEYKRKILQIFSGDKLITSKQTHSDIVIDVENEIALKSPADGIFTAKTKEALIIRHADCQAAIFYDPVTHRLANVHSGWRGSVQNIYKRTVELFLEKGSRPENLFVAISPSLGPTFAEFKHFEKELPEFFHQFKLGECHFDFWQASISQLKELGILEEHIQVASICTHTNSKEYFSYRRDKAKGRNGTVAMLL